MNMYDHSFVAAHDVDPTNNNTAEIQQLTLLPRPSEMLPLRIAPSVSPIYVADPI
jgi:hypothetical protein